MTQLIIFCAEKYTNDQAGYDKALSMGNDITNVKTDNGECSYSIMYNVSGAINAMEELTGRQVNFGAVRNGVYVSVSEMDEIACNDEMNNSWDCLDAGFDLVIEDRQEKNSAENLIFHSIATDAFQKFSLEIPNLTYFQFIKIGAFINGLKPSTLDYCTTKHAFTGHVEGMSLAVSHEIPKPVET